MALEDRGGVYVHSHALLESQDVGQGTRVWAFAHVMPEARVGALCNIGENVFIEGGAVLGDGVTVKNGVQLWSGVTCENNVFLGPNATFTNDLRPRSRQPMTEATFKKTRVCEGASVGANATVVPGVTIGVYAMVGAGAVVTRDVPDHALVVGNPARQRGWVCRCGDRLTKTLSCSTCGRNFVQSAHGLTPAV